MSDKPLIIITGASYGIGHALSVKLAQQNYPCLLISRDIERLSPYTAVKFCNRN